MNPKPMKGNGKSKFFHCVLETIVHYFCQESCFTVDGTHCRKSLWRSIKYLLNIGYLDVHIQMCHIWPKNVIWKGYFWIKFSADYGSVLLNSLQPFLLKLKSQTSGLLALWKMSVMLYIYLLTKQWPECWKITFI